MDGSDDYSQFLDEGEFDESFNATNASFVDEFEAIRNEITSKVLGYYAHVIYNGDSNALTQGARVRRRSDQNEYWSRSFCVASSTHTDGNNSRH